MGKKKKATKNAEEKAAPSQALVHSTEKPDLDKLCIPKIQEFAIFFGKYLQNDFSRSYTRQMFEKQMERLFEELQQSVDLTKQGTLHEPYRVSALGTITNVYCSFGNAKIVDKLIEKKASLYVCYCAASATSKFHESGLAGLLATTPASGARSSASEEKLTKFAAHFEAKRRAAREKLLSHLSSMLDNAALDTASVYYCFNHLIATKTEGKPYDRDLERLLHQKIKNPEIIKALLLFSCTVHPSEKDHMVFQTFVGLAVAYLRLEVRQPFLEQALILSAGNGLLLRMKLLLNAGADIDASHCSWQVRDGDEQTRVYEVTPLMSATLNNQTKAAQYLLSKNANSKKTVTPIDSLMQKRQALTEIIQLLQKTAHQFDLNFFNNQQVNDEKKDATEQRKSDISKNAGPEENSHIDNKESNEIHQVVTGTTPLIAAASRGNAVLVDNYLKYDESTKDIRNFQGQTALHAAAENGHVEVVTLLIVAKARLLIKDFHNFTAREIARTKKHHQIAKLLLAAELKLWLKDFTLHQNDIDSFATLLMQYEFDFNSTGTGLLINYKETVHEKLVEFAVEFSEKEIATWFVNFNIANIKTSIDNALNVKAQAAIQQLNIPKLIRQFTEMQQKISQFDIQDNILCIETNRHTNIHTKEIADAIDIENEKNRQLNLLLAVKKIEEACRALRDKSELFLAPVQVDYLELDRFHSELMKYVNELDKLFTALSSLNRKLKKYVKTILHAKNYSQAHQDKTDAIRLKLEREPPLEQAPMEKKNEDEDRIVDTDANIKPLTSQGLVTKQLAAAAASQQDIPSVVKYTKKSLNEDLAILGEILEFSYGKNDKEYLCLVENALLAICPRILAARNRWNYRNILFHSHQFLKWQNFSSLLEWLEELKIFAQDLIDKTHRSTVWNILNAYQRTLLDLRIPEPSVNECFKEVVEALSDLKLIRSVDSSLFAKAVLDAATARVAARFSIYSQALLKKRVRLENLFSREEVKFLLEHGASLKDLGDEIRHLTPLSELNLGDIPAAMTAEPASFPSVLSSSKESLGPQQQQAPEAAPNNRVLR